MISKIQLLAALNNLKKNTAKTKQEVQEYQQKKLRQILIHAYDNSPYYHRTFSAEGITKQNINTLDLSAFPTIDKQTLLRNFDELVTTKELKQDLLRQYDENEKMSGALYKGKYHVIHSSGSTGKPGYFVYDDEAWNTMLLGIIRAALWDLSTMQIVKLLLGRPRVLYVAATDGRYAGVMAAGDSIEGVGAKQLRLDINAPLEQWIEKVQAFNPNIIIGYPSAVKILAELAQTHSLPLAVKRVITCGEPLDSGLRRYLESVFKTKILNFYGASESLALGVEQTPAEGMILFDDLNIIESISGKMYITSLYNYAQPLIRYRLTDTITLRQPSANEACGFTRAEGLLGRSDDVLWFDKNGKRDFLHPLAVEGFCIEGLKDYQFRKTGDDAFEMIAEISNKAQSDIITDMVVDRMKSILTEKKLGSIKFSVRHTDRILPDPYSGKKRLIV